MSEPLIMRVAPPAPRPTRDVGDHEPSFGTLIAGLFYAIDGMVIGGTVCPGLLLCVPAILLVVVPLIVIGMLLLLLGLAVAGGMFAVVLAAKLAARLRNRLATAVATRTPTRDRLRPPERRAQAIAVLSRVRGDRDV